MPWLWNNRLSLLAARASSRLGGRQLPIKVLRLRSFRLSELAWKLHRTILARVPALRRSASAAVAFGTGEALAGLSQFSILEKMSFMFVLSL